MEQIKKQAILLLIHNNFEYVETVLKLLDSKYFDFFIHIDSSVNQEETVLSCDFEHSNCYFIKDSERMNIRWGDFSIVEAELKLLKLARNKGNYKYYHLLSGADFILKTPKQIFDFFNNSEQVEYINYFDIPREKESFFLNRYRFKYHIKYPKKKTLLNKLFYQFYINVNQLIQSIYIKKATNHIFKVGSQWFSITQNCVDYVLSQEKTIYDLFTNSLVPDESFLQTVVCTNEDLAQNVVKDATTYLSIKRAIQFIDGKPKVWTNKDFEYLVNSGAFFARKLNKGESDELVKKLVNVIRKECGDGN